MVVGFNHNFRYKGEVYHVQTEDSGINNPHIITLLYRGGTILASEKTSYADIIKIDGLKGVVEDLMKDQHRQMLRRLKSGELDQIIGAAEKKSPPPAASPPKVNSAVQGPSAVGPPPERVAVAPPSGRAPENAARKRKIPENSLDEIILSYLAGEEK